MNVAITALRDRFQRITGFLSIACDISMRKREQAQIEHLAHHDQLTGLPNRYSFYDRVERAKESARRKKGMVGVLELDLDRFKGVDDSQGHQVGDRVQKVAEILQHCVRSADSVTRFGGDEFVLILPDIAQIQDCVRVAAFIIDALSVPLSFEGNDILVTTNVRISIFPAHVVHIGERRRAN